MLTIWGRRNSINVQKVLWCCAELDLRYERIDAGLAFGVNDTPDYLARNPTGLVPTIDDDGFVLWESNTIVRYLANKHGLGTLCPSQITDRFDVERWMDWQATQLWPAMRPVFFGLVRTPPEKRDQAAIEAAMNDTERALAILDRHLAARRFVGGDVLTMGDIPVGVSIHRWYALGVARTEFPNLAQWYGRLMERPGFSDTVSMPLS